MPAASASARRVRHPKPPRPPPLEFKIKKRNKPGGSHKSPTRSPPVPHLHFKTAQELSRRVSSSLSAPAPAPAPAPLQNPRRRPPGSRAPLPRRPPPPVPAVAGLPDGPIGAERGHGSRRIGCRAAARGQWARPLSVCSVLALGASDALTRILVVVPAGIGRERRRSVRRWRSGGGERVAAGGRWIAR